MGQWIKELAAGLRAFADRLGERQSLMLPAEEPDYADLGPAFPSWDRISWDAIALEVSGAQRVGFIGAVLELGPDGEGGLGGERGEGVDEQLPEPLVESGAGDGWQIRRACSMPSRWHT